MSLRAASLATCLVALLSACPAGDDGGTTEAASSSVGPTTGGSSTGPSVATDSTGVGMTSFATGNPALDCEDATTQEECMAADSPERGCGWVVTRMYTADGTCTEAGQGGLCFITSRSDDTCGINLEPSCMGTDVVVYVRPSPLGDGSIETLAVGSSDVCDGPSVGEGWEACAPDLMMEGCSCACP